MHFDAGVDARPRLLILTAGPHQAPILRRARALGYFTVAADRDPSAAAKPIADVALTLDVTDRRAVLDAARCYGVAGVLAEQTDIAVPTAAFVCAELGLPGHSVATADRTTNKRQMRDVCRGADIRMPAYHFVQTWREAHAAAAAIGFPVVTKPVDSQGSRGVTRVDDVTKLEAAFHRAHAASHSGGVLVEELICGIEGSIESIVSGGRVTVLAICEKRKSPPPYPYDLELFYPGDYSATIRRRIVELNAAVIRAVGVTDGLTHLEFFVDGEDAVLIEIAARGCGARVATDLLPALTEIDLLGLRLRQAVGAPVTIPEPRFERHGILRFIELPPGRIERIGGLAAASSVDGVLLLHLARAEGDVIKTAVDCDGRPGFIMTAAHSREAARSAANRALAALEIKVVHAPMVAA